MFDSLRKNWGRALGEVCASMIGALGVISLVALVLVGQHAKPNMKDVFLSYFSGGQIGLSILSISGVIFIALLRHKPTHQLLAVILYVLFIGPIVITSIIIGMNPGFETDGLNETVLRWLWIIFFGFHALWFFLVALEPMVPDPQEAGAAEENRVNKIKAGATGRAQ